MKRLSLLLVTLAIAGCRDNSASIIPVGLCSPPTDAKTCGSSGKCTTFLAGQTFLYLGFGGGFLHPGMRYFMQFDNQTPLNGDPGTFRTNTHDAWVEEVSMTYSMQPTYLTSTAPFAVPGATSRNIPTLVRASSQGTPMVTLIPPDTVNYLASRIAPNDMVLLNVEVRGRGHYVDQSSFETGSIIIPVWIINADFPAYTCPDPAATVTDVCPVAGEGGATIACSGSGGGGAFTIGGTISGLTGAGLVLSTSGVSDLTVPAGSGTFQFASGVADGTAYNVTVTSQPAGQFCVVNNGSGTVAGSSISSVSITCT